MSRFEHENKQFMSAFGADPFTGSFVQVWEQPHLEQDNAVVVIDNMGVRILQHYDSQLTPLQESKLDSIRLRFEQARAGGNDRPNIDAETAADLLTAFGFDRSIEKAIYKAFD